MEKELKNSDVRSPIVVILGHVDHGKTTLLDTVRKTRVAQKEVGGITQAIGASQAITAQGKKITFIDTPGHAAFSKMRGRGAKVADIAVLVVAADDGVQPQTKEAIELIKGSQVPFIVAITKVDLATANIESTLGQLEKEEVFLEKRGGDVSWLEISAKTGKGIDELLELISLMAEMEGLKGSENDPLEAVVIESSKDNSGCLANVVVRSGSISVGEKIYAGNLECKVKNLMGFSGPTKKVLAGDAAQILGFSEVPLVGTKIVSTSFDDEKESVNERTGKLQKEELGIVIKAQNAGALEAIIASLPDKVVVIASGVGDINESDILNAKSSGVKYVFGFEVKIPTQVIKLSEAEDLIVENFTIIYELFQKLEEIIKKGQILEFGKAEVIAEFPFNNKRVAGCRVVSGKISKVNSLYLVRDNKDLGKIKALSIKKQKSEVSEVSQGEEFGIFFAPQLDFQKGDMLVSRAS